MYRLIYTHLFEKKIKKFKKDKELVLVAFGHRKDIYQLMVLFSKKGGV